MFGLYIALAGLIIQSWQLGLAGIVIFVIWFFWPHAKTTIEVFREFRENR